MKKIRLLLISFLLTAFAQNLKAQAIPVSDLFMMLDLSPNSVDTLLKSKGYRILEKEKDSTANLVYYTNLDKTREGATWVRSVSITEQTTDRTKNKVINYRTYRKKEYQEIAKWLLNNNFKTASRENYGREVSTIYSDGERLLLIKVSVQKLPNGTPVSAYELEVGSVVNKKR